VRRWSLRYGRPVFLTETCHPGSSVELRVRWLDDSVGCLRRLRAEGVDVIGYTWWPLFDMIDWRYREGHGRADRYLMESGLYELITDGAGSMARRATRLVDRFQCHAQSGARL
jgi:hypothetical protein